MPRVDRIPLRIAMYLPVTLIRVLTRITLPRHMRDTSGSFNTSIEITLA